MLIKNRKSLPLLWDKNKKWIRKLLFGEFYQIVTSLHFHLVKILRVISLICRLRLLLMIFLSIFLIVLILFPINRSLLMKLKRSSNLPRIQLLGPRYSDWTFKNPHRNFLVEVINFILATKNVPIQWLTFKTNLILKPMKDDVSHLVFLETHHYYAHGLSIFCNNLKFSSSLLDCSW